MHKDYNEISSRQLQNLYDQCNDRITKLREKLQETRSRWDKEIKAQEDRLRTLQAKQHKELEAITKQGNEKIEEHKKVMEVMNQKGYAEFVVDERVKVDQPKQSTKENTTGNTQTPKPQETKQHTSDQNAQTQQQGR
ncbi:hypothetical protein NHP190003_15950 (plasmid) [Helicobacter sp. NHP19-003]|uniref:Uncharacterized protein n=1 Tax=Helicobacter gastrocanis TaxID=2849641 RepID=A0ABM7SL03_9HELI|nr:hypothetical protein [Helicobacter sp. NHP19-003]BCZ18313.1 hypothetical protein NHP190003_15950 [Helicobacter sp. NHP19-003]